MSGRGRFLRCIKADHIQTCSVDVAWDSYQRYANWIALSTQRWGIIVLIWAAFSRAYLARYCELERADLAYEGVFDLEVIRDPRRLIDIPGDRKPIVSMPSILRRAATITGIGRTGPVHLIDVIKAGEVVSPDLSRRYYGRGKFELEGCRKVRTDRYVFKRDDSEGYVIVPEKILDKVVQWN